MKAPLAGLGFSVPVLAAPMAGGPTGAAMVVAASIAGSLGFVAGGYKSVDALATQIADVREHTSVFGVNLFAPNPVPVDAEAYRAYREALRAEADRVGVELPDVPREDDDGWHDKIAHLVSAPVPLVSFTFGIPDTSTVSALHRAGSVLVQTVTSVAEARAAREAGVDALAVQSADAGGHFGTLSPREPSPPVPLTDLVPAVADAVELPVIAAGGLADAADIATVLQAGADAVMVGTALLLSDESEASVGYQGALADPGERTTVVTRAFTGRPARGLRNRMIERFDATAPLGYPAIHHLTSPLRRACAAAGDPEWINLWAGTGFRRTRRDSVLNILTELTP
jgi:NAD(P)H-dependent flavin oxidoreductase YrpB (nitropropane dioxygenase family)